MNIPLLRSSFALVVERQPALVERFYEILFSRYPQARPLFGRNTQAAQAKMLTQALVLVVDHLEDPAWLTQTLEPMGARHLGYGVTEVMYDWVGECLLAALAEAAGADWSAALQDEWAGAYGFIARTMQDGARRARSAA